MSASYTEPFRSLLSNQAAIDSAAQFGWSPPPLIQDASWQGTPWNFLALTFCLMAGTAGLPHILIRSYTSERPTVRFRPPSSVLRHLAMFRLSIYHSSESANTNRPA